MYTVLVIYQVVEQLIHVVIRETVVLIVRADQHSIVIYVFQNLVYMHYYEDFMETVYLNYIVNIYYLDQDSVNLDEQDFEDSEVSNQVVVNQDFCVLDKKIHKIHIIKEVHVKVAEGSGATQRVNANNFPTEPEIINFETN